MVVSASHFKDVVNGYEKRTDGLWVHKGKAVFAGSVTLPAGTAQQVIGNYASGTTWSSTTTGAWLSPPVTTGSIACSGVACRIECSTVLSHSVAGGYYYTGLLVDGGLAAILSILNQAVAGYQMPLAWTYYHTPPAGNHVFTLGINNASAGTLAIWSGITSTLYVTEQRA